jgi:P4 family phage/plasmid primase-like protien
MLPQDSAVADATRGERGTWRWLGYWNDDGRLNLSATAASLATSDLDAALLMSAERPDELHYVTASDIWHIWDGKCHRRDDSGRASRLVQNYALRCERILREVRENTSAAVTMAWAPGEDIDARAMQLAITRAMEPFSAAVKHAARLKSSAGSTAVERELAKLCGTSEEDLAERWPAYLNCANGVVHLVTGQIYPHDPRWMMTYCLDVPYDPQAKAPWFDHLLGSVAGWDTAVMWHLRKVLGYCLMGSNPEQLIFFLCGDTASGKSQMLDAIRSVLGSLSVDSPSDLISVCRQGRSPRVEWSCAGTRMVTITETSGHRTTDEAQVKRLTGEASITVDRLYSRTRVQIPVTFTVVQTTNEMQTLVHCDDAVRRRIEVIPTGPSVPPEQQVKDLAKKIIERGEGPGILALLVAGAIEYSAHGLEPPAQVVAETARYVDEQNTAEGFRADCTMVATGLGNGTQPWVARTDLWKAYLEWSAGGPRLRKRQFLDQAERWPGVYWNDAQRRFEGIMLVRARSEVEL